MKTLAYYEALPDSMNREQLHVEFVEVLAADPRSEAELISEALFLLSERQWNTYELADEELRAGVAAMILKLWDDHDAKRAGILLGVTGQLGLEVVLRRLRENGRSKYSTDVRKVVDEAISEFGNTVDDPYSGMRK